MGGAPASGRLSLTPQPRRAVRLTAVVPRGQVPRVRDMDPPPREELQRVGGLGAGGGARGRVGAVGPRLRAPVVGPPVERDRIPGAVPRARRVATARSSSGPPTAVCTCTPEGGPGSMPAAGAASKRSRRTNSRSTARRNASGNRAVSCTGHERSRGRGGRGAAEPPASLDCLSDAMLAAAMAMQGADVTPTARQVADFGRARAQYRTVMQRWAVLAKKGREGA